MSVLRARIGLTLTALLAAVTLPLGAAWHGGALGRTAEAQPATSVGRVGTAPAVAPVRDVAPVAAPRIPERAAADHVVAEFPGIDSKVLRLALAAHETAIDRGLVERPDLLTVIDYSLPSTAKRLWVLDLANGKVLFHELVAHGKNTGDNFARAFSNRDKSLQTSLGLFRTAGTYTGHNGYSMKLQGLEPGFNDEAESRSVVMHGAPYVSEQFAAEHGRIGRSWGCPALSQKVAGQVIDTIKGGSLVFSYFPDQDWLQHSRFVAPVAGTFAAGAH